MTSRLDLTKLKDKIQTGLDESRILVLGAQILVGFAFSANFQPTFSELPRSAQSLNLFGLALMLVTVTLFGLALMLVTVTLLISPVAFHQLNEEGDDSVALNRFTTNVMKSVLMLFALSIGAGVFVSVQSTVGDISAAVLASTITLISLLFWYGPHFLVPSNNNKSGRRGGDMDIANQLTIPTSVHEKIRHVLTEARVILPGNQALLGFQLAVTLQQGFRDLPAAVKLTHIVSLSFIAFSTIVLLAPAPYHRIVEGGEETETFFRTASWFVLSSLPPMAAGLSADFFVVVYKISNSWALSIAASVTMLCFCCGMWFGYPIYRKRYPGLVHAPSGAVQ